MFFTAASEALHSAFPAWPLEDGRHLTTYLVFLLGVGCFYVVCLRFMRRGTALIAAMLFLSQPLLFGSAFIDQKDIPFMTCFLAVVASGLAAAEIRRPMDSSGTAQARSSPRVVVRGALDALRADWVDLGEHRRKRLLIAFLGGLCIIVDLLFVGLLHRVGEAVLTAAYGGRAPWPAQQLFQLVATDAYKTPVELYLGKYEQFFVLLRLTATAAFLVGVCGGFALALPSIRKLWKGDWTIAQLPALLVSAGFLGCSIAIRQIRGFAGGMVSLYLLYRGRGRAILPVLLYWAITCWLSCTRHGPYLWPDAFQRFRESFLVIGTFADHKVLFQGQRFGSAELPWNYLPTLVALELTEPAVILSSIGLLVFLRRIVTRRLGWSESGLLASSGLFPRLMGGGSGRPNLQQLATHVLRPSTPLRPRRDRPRDAHGASAACLAEGAALHPLGPAGALGHRTPPSL